MSESFHQWFQGSFWLDLHYGAAFAGTLVVIGVYAFSHRFDVGFGSFVAGLWLTAAGNDALNMPPIRIPPA